MNIVKGQFSEGIDIFINPAYCFVNALFKRYFGFPMKILLGCCTVKKVCLIFAGSFACYFNDTTCVYIHTFTNIFDKLSNGYMARCGEMIYLTCFYCFTCRKCTPCHVPYVNKGTNRMSAALQLDFFTETDKKNCSWYYSVKLLPGAENIGRTG